jgi:hypothetical protein
LCEVDHYRSESNADYRPDSLNEQELQIIVRHDRMETLTIPITFTPE